MAGLPNGQLFGRRSRKWPAHGRPQCQAREQLPRHGPPAVCAARVACAACRHWGSKRKESMELRTPIIDLHQPSSVLFQFLLLKQSSQTTAKNMKTAVYTILLFSGGILHGTIFSAWHELEPICAVARDHNVSNQAQTKIADYLIFRTSNGLYFIWLFLYFTSQRML